MSDSVHLLIDGKKIDRFLSYKIESNLFTADDAFTIEVAGLEWKIKKGTTCELYVNDVLEMTGIIVTVNPSYGKDGRKLTIEGRDRMWIPVDSYCEEFPTLENVSLKVLAQRLLKDMPFIRFSDIVIAKANKLRAVTLSQRKEDYQYVQIMPGQTVFEVLRDYALARGYLFFAMPDGTFIFGEPMTSGYPRYYLVNRRDGRGNNILRGSMRDSIEGRYSHVTVYGQKQPIEGEDAGDVNLKATVSDPDWDLEWKKPFVAVREAGFEDSGSLRKNARVIMEQQKFQGFSLEYVVPGHSQQGNNYQTNEICQVTDEDPQIEIDGGDFLIYGRTFEMDRDKGTRTSLQLSKLGVMPA